MMRRSERIELAVFKVLVRACDAFRAHGLLAKLLKGFVKEIDEGGQLKPLRKRRESDKIGLLILSRDHFRGDVPVLAAEENFVCLDLNTQLQRYLLSAFVSQKILQEQPLYRGEVGQRAEFRAQKPGSAVEKGRKKYRTFLRRFLPALYDMVGVDVVLNSDERYRRHADITQVSSELHYPHISIQREAMFVVPTTFLWAVERHKELGNFFGDIILVQNEISKKVFIESNYAPKEKVEVVGCLRMDEFLKRLEEQPQLTESGRKSVVMFTGQASKRLKNGSRFQAFDASRISMRSIARVVKQRPDVDFYVKFKDQHLGAGVMGPGTGSQLDILQDIAREQLGRLDDYPNLHFIKDEISPADLILRATIVTSMQSTTVLEAAVAARPVILPHFKEIIERDGAEEYLMYLNDHDLFDVPGDEDEMVKMLLDRLENSTVEEQVMEKRREMFNTHVSPLTADASIKVVNIIEKFAQDGRIQRGLNPPPYH